MRIHVLPKELIDRIAAGEVVERPASVLKELVENALDAEASAIGVAVGADAVDSIEVSDNGIGMSREELSMALKRHATSKIGSEEDIDNIRTLGFRGEALPSIAAVADLKVETRTRDAPYGIRACYEAGAEKSVRELGMAAGTRMIVTNLFRHTPARRKFLRSRQTEMGHVLDLFVRLALSRTDVSFQLRRRNGELGLNAPATDDLRQRAAQLLGWELAERLYPISEGEDFFRIRGLAGPPDLHKATPQGIFLFVNQRPIRDLGIQRALRHAYQGSIPRERLPVSILFLSLPHGDVDVNVHPTKQEVRFSHPLAVHEAVRSAVSRLLRQAPWQGANPGRPDFTEPARIEMRPPSFSPVEGREEFGRGKANAEKLVWENRPETRPYETGDPIERHPAVRIRETPAAQPAPMHEEQLWEDERANPAALRLIGQFRDSYLICESREGVVLIDQHAAHERLAYEELQQAFQGKGIPQQPLLSPVLVELPPQQAECLQEHLDTLTVCGMEVDFFGGAAFVVKTLPALLAGTNPPELLRDIAEDLVLLEQSARLGELRKDVLARMACHAVVRAGRSLEKPEMEALLRELDSKPELSTCPHGRPVRILLSLREIEKRFQRT